MEKEFEKYGPEWQKEMKKFRKDELISMIADLRKSAQTENVEKVIVTVQPGKMLIDFPGLTKEKAKNILLSAIQSMSNHWE